MRSGKIFLNISENMFSKIFNGHGEYDRALDLNYEVVFLNRLYKVRHVLELY